MFEWLDKTRLNSLIQRFDKTVSLQDHPEKRTLKGLEERVRKNMEDEMRGQRFIDRLKTSIIILMGKKNG